MADEHILSDQEALGEALAHLRSALVILDSVDAPAQIGAHIDLAHCQLCELLASSEGFAIDAGPDATTSRH